MTFLNVSKQTDVSYSGCNSQFCSIMETKVSQTRGLKTKCSVFQQTQRVAMENLVTKVVELQMLDVDVWKHFGLTVSENGKELHLSIVTFNCLRNTDWSFIQVFVFLLK